MNNTIKNKQASQDIANIRSIRNILQQRWLVVVLALMLTGLGAAITGVLFKAGVHSLEDWRLKALKTIPDWLVLPTMGTLGGFVSGTLITNVAPAARGSGVSHIMAYLRHKAVPMGLKVGLVKLVAGIIAIGSGFPLGPEGPSIQMGGSIAWKMARWLKAPIAFRRVIVAAGGGAGIAAIFSAPIGGFIYAIEELLNSARPAILTLIVITTFWADTWADVLQNIGLDPSAGGFDQNIGFLIEREYSPKVQFLPIDFGYLIVLGIVIGVLAELYCRFILKLQAKNNDWFGTNLTKKLTISGLLIGVLYSLLPDIFHNINEIQSAIANETATINIAIATFIILFISSGIAAGSGAPGGLFYPMLTLGGSIGLAFGISAEFMTGYVPDSYIFAGMGAFVAACSRTTVTAMFLAFALTKNLLLLKPILIACISSYLIARMLNKSSIYHRQIQMEFNAKSDELKEV